jgi:hypothetical protein
LVDEDMSGFNPVSYPADHSSRLLRAAPASILRQGGISVCGNHRFFGRPGLAGPGEARCGTFPFEHHVDAVRWCSWP